MEVHILFFNVIIEKLVSYDLGSISCYFFTQAWSFPSVLTLIDGVKGQGELAVAQGKPLPPFERWSFGEERYMQFLQDQVSILIFFPV